MKKYRKLPTKLLQVRLSKKEYDVVTEFIKRFGITKREWLTTAINQLQFYYIIRDGKFWTSDKEYAYEFNDKWDKQLNENSVCEVCNKRFPEGQHGHGLQRHHHDGYEGENAFKVHIVCCKHHGEAHKAMRVGIPWERFIKSVIT